MPFSLTFQPVTMHRLSKLTALPLLLTVVGYSDCGSEPPAPVQACYMGTDRSHTTCFPVVSPDPMPTGYDYPAPLNGSAQYEEPVAYLDLYALADDVYVAPNFKLGELAQDYKGQYAVVQSHAVDRIQAIRDELGPLVVNSGYRSPGYNVSIGGASSSRHMYGDAFDMAPSNNSLTALADACYRHDAGYVEVYDTFVHCDWRYDPLDPAFYGASVASLLRQADQDKEVYLMHIDNVWAAPVVGWSEGEPLREWRAYDEGGNLLKSEVCLRFVAPPDTAKVEVTVGHYFTRSAKVSQ